MFNTKLAVRSALVSMSLALFGALGLAACAAPVSTGEEEATADEEQVGAAKEALQQCCYGTLTCPTTGHHYSWYTGPISCGSSDEKYTVQATACNSACTQPCTNVQLGCTTN
jgi:hypothetical protein